MSILNQLITSAFAWQLKGHENDPGKWKDANMIQILINI